MKLLASWMFRAMVSTTDNQHQKRLKSDSSLGIEEIANDNQVADLHRERLIVYVVWTLIAVCILSFVVYLFMSWVSHPKVEDVRQVFMFTLTTLVGYFLGTNKRRDS